MISAARDGAAIATNAQAMAEKPTQRETEPTTDMIFSLKKASVVVANNGRANLFHLQEQHCDSRMARAQ
jgi:hypothetical protein